MLKRFCQEYKSEIKSFLFVVIDLSLILICFFAGLVTDYRVSTSQYVKYVVFFVTCVMQGCQVSAKVPVHLDLKNPDT